MVPGPFLLPQTLPLSSLPFCLTYNALSIIIIWIISQNGNWHLNFLVELTNGWSDEQGLILGEKNLSISKVLLSLCAD
jgi:hypothetical protein